MYCHNCGEQLPEEARFCFNCGNRVTPQDEHSHELDESDDRETIGQQDSDEANSTSNLYSNQEDVDINDAEQETEKKEDTSVSFYDFGDEHSSNEQSDEEQTSEQNVQKRSTGKTSKGFLPYILPLACLLLFSAIITVYYSQQKNINEQVLALQESGEEAAINGDYTKAIEDLNNAQELRPDYTVLNQSIMEIERADQTAKTFDQISEKIQAKQFAEAEEQLASLESSLQNETGPLFIPFTTLITEKQVMITVGKVKQELNSLQTISELSEKLNQLASLSSDEGAAVKEQILAKIVKISSDQANTALAENQFSDAIDFVNEGLTFASNNKTLLTLKEKVEQEKNVFEQAEQERLEKAMEAAAKEDLKNRTAAVEVTTFETYIDEYGDLVIYGDIKNVATREIYEITVYYTVYDTAENYVDEGYITVYPYYLSPGETGSFEDSIWLDSIYDELFVEIDNVEWYLD